MSDSDRFALAASVHLTLRLRLGRVVDAEWLVQDASYVREIRALCARQENPQFVECVAQLDDLLAAILADGTPAPRALVDIDLCL